MSASLLGVPLRFETGSTAVARLVRSIYGAEPRLPAAADAPLLRIDVDDGLGVAHAPPQAALPHANRLSLTGPGVSGEADAERGTAWVRVSSSALEAPWLREAVLDHITLFLVTFLDRAPVHAAAVARDGVALLLAGPGGLGKSSLAYAAMCAGWSVLSDDVVFVQLSTRRTVWALPRGIHLSPSAAAHFPDVAGAAATVRPDGRTKLRVPVPEASRAPIPWAGPTGLCLLSHASPDRATLEPLSTAEAVDEARAMLQGGFDRFDHVLDACIGATGAGGCWRLSRNADPTDLVRHLDDARGVVRARQGATP